MDFCLFILAAAAGQATSAPIVRTQPVTDSEVVVRSTGKPETDEPAIMAGVAEALADGKELRLWAADKVPFRIEHQLVFAPPEGEQSMKLDIVGQAVNLNPTIVYTGSDEMIKVFGLKHSTWSNLHVRLMTDGATAFWIATGGDSQSTSGNNFDADLVECQGKTRGTQTGWLTCPADKGAADISFMHWSQCYVSGSKAARPVKAGWKINGANTLQLSWQDSGGYGCDGYMFDFTEQRDKYEFGRGGGDASVVVNGFAGYSGGFAYVPTGHTLTVIGGRAESCDQPLFRSGAGRDATGLIDVYSFVARGSKELVKEDGASKVKINGYQSATGGGH